MLLTQFFYPDESAISRMGTDLAEDLVSFGFRVTVVASRGRYLGGKSLPAREHYKGIDIERSPATSLGKSSLAARVTDYATYSAGAFAEIAFRQKPDIILAMSTPPFVAAIAAVMKVLRGVPFAYWAQDLYPELAVEFGVLRRGSLATKILERASSMILRRADAIITVGQAMAARLIAKGACADRVHIVPNWADPAVIWPVDHADNPFRAAHGLDGKQVVLYSGNMGRSHDIETVLAVAARLRDRKNLAFLFIGDGAKTAMVADAARDNPAIQLLPYQLPEMLPRSLSAGDVHVVTQEAWTIGMMEPSKLYGVMAAGRPVMFIGPRESETAQTVLRERIGTVTPNGDGRSAVDALNTLLVEGPAFGKRARSALELKYGRSLRTTAIAHTLQGLAR